MDKTLFDKVWDSHIIEKINEGPDILFIYRHMIHEVTSPVAFIGLKKRGLKVMSPKFPIGVGTKYNPFFNLLL